MNTDDKIQNLFKNFAATRILVIGDVMLDAYIWGDVERISPEAPVPIVSVKSKESRLGGAANVALNLKALGASPLLCSVIGNDIKAQEFINLLDEEKLPSNFIVKSNNRKTTTKFRIIGNNVQLLRVDDEITTPINKTENKKLTDKIKTLIENNKVDVILFQDYDKGVISKELIDTVTNLALTKKIPVAVDPKKNNFLHYKNVSLFKPNLKELEEGLNINVNLKDIATVEKAVSSLQSILNAGIIMSTLSEGGVFTRWQQNGKYFSVHQKAHIRNIADVSGAGDTVISVAALCLAQGMSPDKITQIANIAGGLVCEEVGVVPVNKNRLIKEILNSGVLG